MRLRKLKFDGTYGEDLDQKALQQKVGQFAGRVDGVDMAVVYFAGHGRPSATRLTWCRVIRSFLAWTPPPMNASP